MRGTKIFVFQLRDILKTAAFAILGILVIILLVRFLLPGNKEERSAGEYQPGTYTAQIILHNLPIDVDVTVTENEIKEIALKNMLATQEVFYPLFKPTMEALSKEIIRTQTTNISSSSDDSVTSKILLDAVNEALRAARTAQNNP